MSIISGFVFSTMSTAPSIESRFDPNIWIPTGLSFVYMSSFFVLFAAFLISPSLDINSVYTTSAPCSLQSALKGGSLTSSIGARRRGNLGSSMFPILIMWQN